MSNSFYKKLNVQFAIIKAINESLVLTPIWLFFDIYYKGFDEKTNCSDVPKFISVNKLTNILLCSQIIVNVQFKTAAHFKEIFLIQKKIQRYKIAKGNELSLFFAISNYYFSKDRKKNRTEKKKT